MTSAGTRPRSRAGSETHLTPSDPIPWQFPASKHDQSPFSLLCRTAMASHHPKFQLDRGRPRGRRHAHTHYIGISGAERDFPGLPIRAFGSERGQWGICGPPEAGTPRLGAAGRCETSRGWELPNLNSRVPPVSCAVSSSSLRLNFCPCSGVPTVKASHCPVPVYTPASIAPSLRPSRPQRIGPSPRCHEHLTLPRRGRPGTSPAQRTPCRASS